MSAATTTSRLSPRASWDTSPSTMRHKKSPTTPVPRSKYASSPPSGKLEHALSTPTGRHRPQQAQGTSTPSYFGLIVDPTNDPPTSDDARRGRKNWSPSCSTKRPRPLPSPKAGAVENNPDFEAFRIQAEDNAFHLGHGNLSHFSRTADKTPNVDAMSIDEPTDRAHAESAPIRPTRQTSSDDPMKMEAANGTRSSPRIPPSSQFPSFFDMPRRDSPATLPTMPTRDSPAVERSHISHIDDRHPRLSLPTNRVTPPSPGASARYLSNRASTLPSSMDQKGNPPLIAPQRLMDLFGAPSQEFLLLDLRVYPQYAQSRISAALNLCIPTTLLKRPSFSLQKLADTFATEDEKRKFERWKTSAYLVVYDDKSSTLKDAVSCVNTVKKFTNEGWTGTACVLRGGFADFAKAFPHMIDRQPRSASSDSSKRNLSIDPAMPGMAPIVGGCPIPSSKSVANPFFGNIRQNMDLIGGVGQISIKHPTLLTERGQAELPRWIRQATDEHDQGKAVSDRFLDIEKAEQRRMQDALSCHVSYGTPRGEGKHTVQIAGVEKGGKNRYNNIWPYDHTRVRLQGVGAGACDYVNASHIKTSRSNKRYIATQAPLPATFNDFWRVVWDQDVRVIVMLTAEREDGQLKAHPYWTGEQFGALKLQPLSERHVSLEPPKPSRPGLGQRRSTNPGLGSPTSPPQKPHIIMRKFTLAHTSHPFTPIREITQLAYSSWPDFGAPAHPTQILGLVEQCDAVLRSSMSPTLPPRSEAPDPPSHRPVLVHCSAGCGRTGAFCTIDSVVDMLKRQSTERLGRRDASPMQIDSGGCADSGGSGGGDRAEDDDQAWIDNDDQDLVAATVEDFRRQRLSMVQNLRQFVLCYEAVLEWLVTQQPEEFKVRGSPAATKENARRSFHG
ncbi:MAG: hypothetical protein M1837_005694 [Sclerophora amabilis]|nr:MAG: hypothetical protein M1837_005694 [Sclerophora amabilis]